MNAPRFLMMMAVLLAGCASSGNDGQGSSQRVRDIASAHTELAAAYFESKQFAVALQELGVALQADPNYAPAYNLRGLLRMELHEDEQAEADFRKSLKLDATSSEAHNNFGWFLCQRGRAGESIAQFQEALKNPLYATPEVAYANAGLCSIEAGDLAQGESFLQRALIMRPDMPQALQGLAELNYRRGNFTVAKNYLGHLLATTPDLSAEQLWLAARIEHEVGDTEAEASYIVQLIKRFPDSPQAKLARGGAR
ncbi:MAG: type IV pilus biogenesis/stability protein PilW [Sideroxydans sp.]